MSDSVEIEAQWTDDLLQRKENAQYLTKYLVNRFEAKPDEKGFVLAVNADWGFGKTYLLKNWIVDMKVDYPTVYFDAWENDFTPEPLVAFIAELDKNFVPLYKKVPAAKKLMGEIREKANAMLKPATNALMGVLAKKLLGLGLHELDELTEGALDLDKVVEKNEATSQEIAKALARSVRSSLKNHAERKVAISAFRRKLEQLVEALNGADHIQLPIFVFIDELDRCRPNYAIELLEGIKHLFGVPGIYFVVATNISQLGESVKAIYGAGFDGHQYLKRFFDLEYSLPLPNYEAFAVSLFRGISVPGPSRLVINLPGLIKTKGANALASVFAEYAKFFSLGLRDQQQVIKIVEAAFLTISNDVPVHVHYLFFLSMLYHRSPITFEKIIKVGTIAGRSEINEVTSRSMSEPAGFSFTTYDYGEPPRTKTVGIPEIAELYMSYAPKDLREIRNDHQSSHQFPQSLVTNLANEMPSQYYVENKYPSSIKSYPNIVRHAGGFSINREA